MKNIENSKTALEETNTKPVVYANHTIKPLTFHDFDSAYRIANMLAISGMLPKSYTAKTNEKERTAMVFAAMQLGAELGMLPLQSIQSIAVVNGMPSVWGDAQKALVIASGQSEYIVETFEGNPNDDTFKAVCRTKRVGKPETFYEFSMADARKANLLNNETKITWKTHTKRMLKYKARSFCLRDEYPDILKGLHSVEELEGENMINVTRSQNNEVLQSAIASVPATPVLVEDKTPLDTLFNEVVVKEPVPLNVAPQQPKVEFSNLVNEDGIDFIIDNQIYRFGTDEEAEITIIDIMSKLQSMNNDQEAEFARLNRESLFEVINVVKDKPAATKQILDLLEKHKELV